MDIDPIEPSQPESSEGEAGETREPWSPETREAWSEGRLDRHPPGPPAYTGTHIVYLDPKLDRPVSPYSPEGEIRMFGEFAAGLSRRGGVSRWMGLALMLVVLIPIVLTLLATFTHL